MLPIDRYAWTNRWRHHHPAEKLLLAGGMLLISLTLPPLTTGPLVVLVMAAATVAGAGIPLAAWLRVLAVPGAFLLSGAPFLALSLDLSQGVGMAFSAPGLLIALHAVVRSLAALSALAFLALTTPVLELVLLLRRGGVPQPVAEIMLLIYRLLFVLAERALAGSRAQAARQGYADLGRSIRSLGLLAASLLERSLAQARRLEIGLAARGFDGELRLLLPRRSLSLQRLTGIAGVLCAVALGGLWGDGRL